LERKERLHTPCRLQATHNIIGEVYIGRELKQTSAEKRQGSSNPYMEIISKPHGLTNIESWVYVLKEGLKKGKATRLAWLFRIEMGKYQSSVLFRCYHFNG
tara:strand:- start:30 stop:332 length:303 start_codon:yes stop_codon:yes gene_type:complete